MATELEQHGGGEEFVVAAEDVAGDVVGARAARPDTQGGAARQGPYVGLVVLEETVGALREGPRREVAGLGQMGGAVQGRSPAPVAVGRGGGGEGEQDAGGAGDAQTSSSSTVVVPSVCTASARAPKGS